MSRASPRRTSGLCDARRSTSCCGVVSLSDADSLGDNVERMDITSVVATAYGGPEVLSVVESRLNDPAPGEVLIEVRAAATNPVDYKLYSGAYGEDPSNLPLPLGFEAAGVVVGINGEPEGPGGRIALGDEVIAYSATGAYASGLLVEADNVLPKPTNMSFEEAS